MTGIQVLFYPDLLMKPPPRLPDTKTQNDKQVKLDLDLEINKDFEENSLYQEGIISAIYQRPDKSQLVEPPELTDLVNSNNIVQKIFAQANSYRQDLENYSKKSIERHPSPCHNKRDTSVIFK